MTNVTVVYWRDIPAQVILGSGRKSVRRELSARFQEAIDMAAMRAKAIGTDHYLEDWRRTVVGHADGDLELAANQWLQKLEDDFGPERLAALVENKGSKA